MDRNGSIRFEASWVVCLLVYDNFMTFFYLKKTITSKLHLQDFVIGLSVLLRGSVTEKLRWAFNLYDINKDGYITKEVQSLNNSHEEIVTNPLHRHDLHWRTECPSVFIFLQEMLAIMTSIYDMMGRCTSPSVRDDAPHDHVEKFFQVFLIRKTTNACITTFTRWNDLLMVVTAVCKRSASFWTSFSLPNN